MISESVAKTELRSQTPLTQEQERVLEEKMRVLANLMIDKILDNYANNTLKSNQETVYNEIGDEE